MGKNWAMDLLAAVLVKSVFLVILLALVPAYLDWHYAQQRPASVCADQNTDLGGRWDCHTASRVYDDAHNSGGAIGSGTLRSITGRVISGG